LKKMTTRLSLLLLMAVLCIINLARAQDANPTSTLAARHYETGKSLPGLRETSISLPARGRFSRSSVTRAKHGPWTGTLAVQLVKRPELNRRQVKIIFDAISLSTSPLLAASDNSTAIRVRADDAVQDLRRRALAAFPKNEVVDLFDNVNDEQSEQEIFKKYSDLSALPLKARRVSFRSTSADQKSGLWRTHFVLYFIKHPELNEWQKEIIVDALLLTTREYFAVPSSSPDWKAKVREPARLLERQIAVAFSIEEAANIFATLGDNTEAAQAGPSVAGSALLKSINYQPVSDSGPYQRSSRFSSQDFEFEQSNSCGCNTDSDFCPMWKFCAANSCNSSQSGCGFAWNHPCNGVCR